jgi:hypothetical protein
VTGFQCQSANRGLAAAWRAGDLVQETLLRVARRWGKVRAMAYPGAYARRVLVNLALDGARRRSRERDELITDDGFGHPPDEASVRAFRAIEDLAMFRSAFTALTGPCWCSATGATYPRPRPSGHVGGYLRALVRSEVSSGSGPRG